MHNQESVVEGHEALLDELSEQDFASLTGGAEAGLSDRLGNQGRFCTVTVECMRWC